MNRYGRTMISLVLAMSVITLCSPLAAQNQQSGSDPLLELLVNKGVLSAAEARTVTGTPAEERDRLAQLLRQKGVITTAELQALQSGDAASAAATPVSGAVKLAPVTYDEPTQAKASTAPKPAPPTVVPAVAPLRVLQLEPAKPGGIIPDIKLGAGASVKLYGFIKASAIYDSSSPYGNDIPLPGFLTGNSVAFSNPATPFDVGPDGSPEFHVKARSTRFGASFEWPDLSPRVAVTGKIEADFEGDFTAVNNRNLSSIRSSQPSLRLAWGRIDFKPTDKTGLYLLGGQDWSLFGSSILPNTIETSLLNAGFGTIWERVAQLRAGLSHNFGGPHKITLAPDFAIAMPAFGNTPASAIGTQSIVCGTPSAQVGCPASTISILQGQGSLAQQLGYGERQGADSQKPEIQGRIVLQFQADKAKGVPPAQIIVTGMHASRTAIVPRTEILSFAPLTGLPGAGLSTQAAVQNAFVGTAAAPGPFFRGATLDTDRYGWQAGFSIPTRFVTATFSYYRGTDLRWYFGGQLYTEINDTAGFRTSGTTQNAFTIQTLDGAPTAPMFGIINGVPRIAPQRAPRSQGGFAELGFPLSRLLHANPAGRNAGWTLNLHYGIDDVFKRDVQRLSPSGGRGIGDVGWANINYKMNQFVTFSLEESYYRTRAIAGPGGELPTFSGVPSRQWKDVRSEFATLFTF
jgi:hypothetical protein